MIVLFLGRNVKEYESCQEEKIAQLLNAGNFRCELCSRQMTAHSNYPRGIRETGQKITITMVWCRKCRKWHALLPDFLLPNKHYSGNEIESVIIDSASEPVKLIDSAASESTVRRWINLVGKKINRAINILKYMFGLAGRAVSEAALYTGSVYSELEQILDMAPSIEKYSGNKLGLANLWLGTNGRGVYI